MQLSPDQTMAVIERGDKCRWLLANETFLYIVDDLTTFHMAALVAAPPGSAGAEAREYHHLLQHGLSQIVAQLQSYANAGEAASKVLELMNRDEDEDIEINHE